MRTLRLVFGYLAGAMLVLSSAAHSLLGWKAVRALLEQAKVPADLLQGMRISWQFGGVAMLAFGLIVLSLFDRLRRGRSVSLVPARIVGAGYLWIGSWALAASGKPFYMVFVVPGVLLTAAAWGGGQAD